MQSPGAEPGIGVGAKKQTGKRVQALYRRAIEREVDVENSRKEMEAGMP